MQKRVLIVILSLCATNIFAQSAEESISQASNQLKEKKYPESIRSLNQAVNSIQKIYLSEIRKALLPEKIAGLPATNSRERGPSESQITGNKIQIYQRYSSKSNQKTDEFELEVGLSGSTISITISNSPEKVFEIANLHSNGGEENFIGSDNREPIYYKGYRAIVNYDTETKHGRFAAIIGVAAIEISYINAASKTALMQVPDIIIIESIIKYFGK